MKFLDREIEIAGTTLVDGHETANSFLFDVMLDNHLQHCRIVHLEDFQEKTLEKENKPDFIEKFVTMAAIVMADMINPKQPCDCEEQEAPVTDEDLDMYDEPYPFADDKKERDYNAREQKFEDEIEPDYTKEEIAEMTRQFKEKMKR